MFDTLSDSHAPQATRTRYCTVTRSNSSPQITSLRHELTSQVNGMHEAADNKRESDASRARLEEEVKLTEATVESDLNVERRKKLQEKQRVRRQVKAQIKELSAELFSKKVGSLCAPHRERQEVPTTYTYSSLYLVSTVKTESLVGHTVPSLVACFQASCESDRHTRTFVRHTIIPRFF